MKVISKWQRGSTHTIATGTVAAGNHKLAMFSRTTWIYPDQFKSTCMAVFIFRFEKLMMDCCVQPNFPALFAERKRETTFPTKSHSTPARFSPDKGSITRFFTASSSSPSPARKSQTSESASPDKSACNDDDVVFVEHTPSGRSPVALDETDSAAMLSSCSAVNGDDSTRLSSCSEEAGGPKGSGGDERQSVTPAKLAFHEVRSGTEDRSTSLAGTNSTGKRPLSSDPETCSQAEDISGSDADGLHSDILSTGSGRASHKEQGFDTEKRPDEKGSDLDLDKERPSGEEETRSVPPVPDSCDAEAQRSRHFKGAGSISAVEGNEEEMEEEGRGAETETETASGGRRDGSYASASLSVTVTQFVSTCIHLFFHD